MNFYSDKIINDIIDNSPLENVITLIEDFKKAYKYLLVKYSSHKIYRNYTKNLLEYDDNIVAFYCMDNVFDIDNCPSMLIYSKHFDMENDEIIYYILFACTKNKYQNQGYASRLLDGLTERIKDENKRNTNKTIKMVLSSVEEAVLFYEAYGFIWTRESIVKHEILTKYEKYEETKDYFVLEKIIYQPEF